MDDTASRLTRCFESVFPELSSDEIETSASTTVHSWDSVAGVTLIAVVEEEFGISIPGDDLSRFSSFHGFLNYLQASSSGSLHSH